MDTECEFDVALSLLAQDEELAKQLAEKLHGRCKVFFYPEQQRKLVGSDGESAFSVVFRERARTVVVLYRAGWGETPWTRVEQQAIRDRARDRGYDFVTFIKLDSESRVPDWFPRQRIYGTSDTLDMNGLVEAILQRIRAFGAELVAERAEDVSRRLRRARAFEAERKKWWGSHEAVQQAESEAIELYAAIERVVESVHDPRYLPIRVFRPPHPRFGILITHVRPVGHLQWKPRYANTLDDAILRFDLWTDIPPGFKEWFFEQGHLVVEYRYTYDWDISQAGHWLSSDRKKYSSADLADEVIRIILAQSEAYDATG